MSHGGQRILQKDETAVRYAVRWKFQREETDRMMKNDKMFTECSVVFVDTAK